LSENEVWFAKLIKWCFTNWWIIAIISAAAGIIIAVFRKVLRRRKTYREHLEPELSHLGLQFLDSRTPGWFDTGPFPRVEVRAGRPQTETPAGRGEYTEYRIVRLQNPSGQVHESWAKLIFEVFASKSIEWKPELSTFISNAEE
jgi:hypothetical protein